MENENSIFSGYLLRVIMECMKIICIDYRLRSSFTHIGLFLFSLHACSLVMFDEKFCLSSPYSSTMQKVLLYHIVVSVIVEWSLGHCQQEHHKLTFAFGSFFALLLCFFNIHKFIACENLCSLPQLPTTLSRCSINWGNMCMLWARGEPSEG